MAIPLFDNKLLPTIQQNLGSETSHVSDTKVRVRTKLTHDEAGKPQDGGQIRLVNEPAGGKEAKLALKPKGTLIIRIMDEVLSNTQELAHIQVTNFNERELDFYSRDLYIRIQKETPL